MAGTKRQRELARQKEERQRARAAEAARRKRVLAGVGGAVVALALVAGVALATAGDDGDDRSPTAAGDAAASPSATTGADKDDQDRGDGWGSPAAKKAAKKVKCTEPTDDQPRVQSFEDGAYEVISFIPGGRYSETMTTNCGEIKFSLDTENAPETTKAMLFLTDRNQFYDNTVCHRLTTKNIYVLQCGDPNGDGTGGPGFTVPDENHPPAENGRATYPRGTVAMANAGPGTTGSQFFLVYDDSPLPVPPGFTIVGEITDGIEVLDHVASRGTADGSGDGAPAQPVQVQKMVGSVTYAAGS